MLSNDNHDVSVVKQSIFIRRNRIEIFLQNKWKALIALYSVSTNFFRGSDYKQNF